MIKYWLIGCLLLATCLLATPAPAVAVISTTPLSVQRILSFKQLGNETALRLSGTGNLKGINFGSRRDELINSVKVRLRYLYSPAMLADLSHLKVLLNGEVVAVLPLPKESAGKPQQSELTLDTRLLADFNRLQFQLIGHYTNHCEDPAHSSLWAEISQSSELEINAQALQQQDDLSQFPEPFFDHRDFARLQLPFVFVGQPSLATVQAAGTLASWFGGLAAWRGSHFTALFNQLPASEHAIVFATNQQRPDFLRDYPAVTAPTIALLRHPQQAERKLLLILGRNEQDLQLAVQALVLGQAAMSGAQAKVERVKLAAPRQPYDAPNWVHPDRPTRLGELVTNQQELQVSGQTPEQIRLFFRVPADIFTWGSRGIPINLRFRYTGLQQVDGSRLSVGINDLFVQSLTLNPSGSGSEQTKLSLPVLDNGLLASIDKILLPPFRVGSRNQLQFQYSYVLEKQGECNSAGNDNFRSALDPDSEIDFSQYPHYTSLPNLGFFANSGYPFTRLADLSDTVVALPKAALPAEVSAFLNVMARLGQSTGYPALRMRLMAAEQTPPADADLLLIGIANRLPWLQRWQSSLPTQITRNHRQVGKNSFFNSTSFNWLHTPTEPMAVASNGQVSFHAQNQVAAMLGFESPLTPLRSVVVLTGSEPAALNTLLEALNDDGKVAQMSGSTVLIKGDNIDSQLLVNSYEVGSLPLWTWVWLYLSQHPLVLALLAALAVCMLAFAILRAFKLIASRRAREE
ncbi:cellulose biosynthesis cyclic di-GMP-binding regulatory protein BcsB [Neisseriaceae bacterium TC5R-5]|nr:cellulose biosynthesis cyclic di-GMP-binding regulatory protein BcsB [Neisseriaceae bacterium TC5R-5]